MEHLGGGNLRLYRIFNGRSELRKIDEVYCLDLRNAGDKIQADKTGRVFESTAVLGKFLPSGVASF